MKTETISGNDLAAETEVTTETEEQTIFESVSSNGTQYTVSAGDSGAYTSSTETTTETSSNTAITELTQEIKSINTVLCCIQFTVFAVWIVGTFSHIVRRFFFNARSD